MQRQAIMFVDPDRRLLMADHSARAMLDDGWLMRLDGGRVEFRIPELDRRLAEQCAHIRVRDTGEAGWSALAARTDEIEPFVLACRGRTPGAPPALVRVCAMRGDVVGGYGRRAAAVGISVFAAGRPARLRGELLCATFGLTNAEARVVAGLADGRSPKQIAWDHAVSVATVRTQLRSIYGKIGVRRQSQLVQILASCPGYWCDDEDDRDEAVTRPSSSGTRRPLAAFAEPLQRRA